jgi:DNA-binding IclR family transcriptional regulator
MPAIPAPVAWTILLVGLLGLRALMRTPRAARARSWAMATPSSANRSGTRARARGWAVDQVDPDRYVLNQVAPSRPGHFVRAAAARFGADAQ